MPSPLKMQSQLKMPGEKSYDNSAFAAGLLNPEAQKPDNVIGPKGAKSDKRYNVYRNNVTVSLINCLIDIFPSVQKIIGEENFRILARDYVRAHPPKSPLLFLYGQEFADFIVGFEPTKNIAFLSDIARIERGWLTAYHAADTLIFDAAKLGQIDPARLGDIKFIAHPASFIIQSDKPIEDIFLINRGFKELGTVDMNKGQALMLTRPETDIRLISLEQSEYAFLKAILSHQTLGEAAACGTQIDENFDLGASLQMLLGTGATISVSLDDMPI